MEIKRLRRIEKKYLIPMGILILAVILLISLSLFSIFKNRTSLFEKYLINKDYNELYKLIAAPEFGEDIFKEYMKYNFGDKIEIIAKEKNDQGYSFKIQGTQGEKNISLVNKKGKYFWDFNDFVYNWQLKVPSDARTFVEGNEVKTDKGLALISKIPSGVYNIKVTKDNCETYNSKIMAGQNIEIKMEPSKELIYMCNNLIGEYLKFKEGVINGGKPGEISCVNKESGIYQEVIDEVSIYTDENFKVTKKLLDFKIESTGLDDESISAGVIERWSVEVNNQGEINKKIDEYKNKYIFNTGNEMKLIQIKTIK